MQDAGTLLMAGLNLKVGMGLAAVMAATYIPKNTSFSVCGKQYVPVVKFVSEEERSNNYNKELCD